MTSKVYIPNFIGLFMAPERRLSPEREREALLCFYSGIKAERVGKLYGLCREWVHAIARRPSELQDPLVELCRKEKSRFRNSALFYLVFNNTEVENDELVDPKKDRDLYFHIHREIYVRKKENLMKNFGLYELIKPTKKLAGLYLLREALFGALKSTDVFNNFFLSRLKEEYQKHGHFNLNEVFDDTREELRETIQQGRLGIRSIDISRVLSELLSSKDRLVIMNLFGFNGEQLKLEEIGKILGVTKQRIYEREQRALEILKDSDLVKCLLQVPRIAE